ncbi:MAG: response regulator transcription factor [Porticoccaceae bacterium]|nr:response regulator transcription factor [Porticoccaceae bacterium]
MATSPSILVVDDDISLCEMMAGYLAKYGYDIHIAHDGQEAVDRIDDLSPDLVILDLMLPTMDGLSVCRTVRNRYKGMILMLTALDDAIEQITGLETGADDYVPKPVSPRLLLARVRTLLRRNDEDSSPRQECSHIDIGPLAIDRGNRTLTLNNRPIRLTSTEFDFIWLLAENAGEVQSRDSLHYSMFRVELEPDDRRIDLIVSRLRKKLGDDPVDPQYIKTVRTQGYLLGRSQ